MNGLLGYDSMEIFPNRETLKPVPWILEDSGVRSPIIGNGFHSYPYRISCKEKGNLYISLSFS
jgi:hypothetical protein